MAAIFQNACDRPDPADASVDPTPSITGKRIGNPGGDVRTMVLGSDGNLLLAGSRNYADPAAPLIPRFDAYFLKIQANGDTLWTRTLGDYDGDVGTGIIPLSDGGVSLIFNTGHTQETSIHFDNSIHRLNPALQTMWIKTYWNISFEFRDAKIALMNNGHILLAGGSTLNGNGDYDITIAELNTAGDTVAVRFISKAGNESVNDLAQTTDGGFVLFGYSQGAGLKPWIAKLDAAGQPVWYKDYPGLTVMTPVSGTVAANQDLAWVSTTPDYQIRAVCTDAAGDTLWTKLYGGVAVDYGYDIVPASGGGYLIAGSTNSFGNHADGYRDAYALHINGTGDTLWTRTYGGIQHDDAYAVQQLTDGSFVLAGTTENFGSGVFFVHIDSSGNVLE